MSDERSPQPTLLDRLKSRQHGVIVLRAKSREGRLSAARELAAQLGLRLQPIGSGTGPTRYIGETEKNLAQALAQSARAGTILFFDEADALFGKRTEVRDSHDRYANQEVTKLLLAADSAAVRLILATSADRVIPRSPAVLAVLDLDRDDRAK